MNIMHACNNIKFILLVSAQSNFSTVVIQFFSNSGSEVIANIIDETRSSEVSVLPLKFRIGGCMHRACP
jgi:hypothetical protein